MRSVVQIYVEGYQEPEAHEILNPRQLTAQVWTGSGFFIKLEGEEGYILTNAHVIRNATAINVMTYMTSEEVFDVHILGYVSSLEPDVALLKLTNDSLAKIKTLIDDLPSLSFANLDKVRRGTEIKAIGYPLGMIEPNITGGEVTNFVSGNEYHIERIVTDAAINPGNSGGPSIIEGGKVVGLNTSIIFNANSVGFITPISYVKRVLGNLANNNEATLADLGASFQKNSKANAEYLGMEEVFGIIICDVDKGGFLDTAGIKKGDVLVSIDREKIDRHGIMKGKEGVFNTIYDKVRLLTLNEDVELEYYRAGKKYISNGRVLKTIEKPIDNQFDISYLSYMSFGGMIIQEVSYEILDALNDVIGTTYEQLKDILAHKDKKIIVTHLDLNSQANRVFVRTGDVIGKVNGEEIHNLVDFKKIINKSLNSEDKTVFIEFESGSIGQFKIEEQVGVQRKKMKKGA
jgi:S1-C subfamily serine protease